MNDEVFLIREEPTERLERVVSAVSEAVKRAGMDKAQAARALGEALTGECPRCRVRVTGEELFALAQLPSSRETNARILRLRQGRCANERCAHSSFRLIFKRHPDLDWARLFLQADPSRAEGSGSAEADFAPKPDIQMAARRGKMIRVGAMIALGLLILLFRQWYLGGRIPLIREPEQFRVDPLPAGAETDGSETSSPSSRRY